MRLVAGITAGPARNPRYKRVPTRGIRRGELPGVPIATQVRGGRQACSCRQAGNSQETAVQVQAGRPRQAPAGRWQHPGRTVYMQAGYGVVAVAVGSTHGKCRNPFPPPIPEAGRECRNVNNCRQGRQNRHSRHGGR